jgi:integrase
MPRKGDNISRTATGRWTARAKTKRVIQTPEGPVTRWKGVERTFDTHEAARQWRRLVLSAEKSGEGWTDARSRPVTALRDLALDYVADGGGLGEPPGDQRFRSSMMGAWLDFLGGREVGDPAALRPVTDLSRELLEAYAASLPAEGRKAQTRYRKVLEAEHMWAWAFDHHPDRYPGVPPKRRYTCGSNDANGLRRPLPVVASAVPRWGDVDAMIRCLELEWHKRVALIGRYTALRASQITGLYWQDVDLERGVLRVRAGVTGAKRGAGRVVPIHPDLVQRMARWERLGPLVFVRRYRDRTTGEKKMGPYRGDVLNVPFRRAWEKSGVARARWDKSENPLPGDRGSGRPVHALRGCFRTELVRAGVEEAIVLYLVGHSQGLTAAAYVPESHPEESPYWPRMVAALERVPAFVE